MEAALLLGSLHGVLLAVALARRAHNRRANRYLAALLVTISLLLADGFLAVRGTLFAHPHLIGLVAWTPFALGPLVYLYVREMTAPTPESLSSPRRHLIIPAIYFVVLVTTFFPRSAEYKLAVAQRDASWIVRAIEVVLLVYGTSYAFAALALLRKHRSHVQDIYSNLRGVSLRWLIVLAGMNALVWLGACVGLAIRVSGVAEVSVAQAIVPIGSTITVFVIGYFQLGQAQIFVPAPAPPPPAPAPVAEPEPVSTDTSLTRSDRIGAKPAPAYQRARLPEDDAADLEARIKAAMTDKALYKQAGLTVGELAEEVAATPHEVSQVLSTRLGKNFYTFVNEHRIEHVKAALLATDRPVLDLAFEAGFQSKSTFNSAFRKATSSTPSEFRERAKR